MTPLKSLQALARKKGGHIEIDYDYEWGGTFYTELRVGEKQIYVTAEAPTLDAMVKKLWKKVKER